MRAFISIELPEEIKKEIYKTFEPIQRNGLVSGNFVEKNSLHITLKFFGNISEEEADKIKKKLAEISFNKFKIKTDGIGFFPSEEHINIMWVGMDSKQILELKHIIDAKLLEIGIEKDIKEFSSHITVARIKSVKDKNALLDKIHSLSMKKSEFSVEKFSLIKSELRSEGPIYKVLQNFDLK